MRDEKPYISIVSPVYQAQGIVDELVKRIKEDVNRINENYEIILVEDGSSDQSWKKIEANCISDKRVKGIKLSRNFGQHYAITAGLKESRGDYVVVMDCDLQDNPKYIIDLINKSKEGYDIVLTTHTIRKHGKLKKIISAIYHYLFNWLVSSKNLEGGMQFSALSLLSRKAVKAFESYNDYHRQYLTIIRFLGFSTTYLPVEHEERFEGKSSYDYKKLIQLAIDGIVSNSEKLLKTTIYTGFSFALIALIAIIYIVIISIKSGFQPGWASTTVLIVFCTGLILISLGIIGIYIGKIFEQTKGRPLYLIDKKINIDTIK